MRVANLTKRSKAAVLHKEINEFFDWLKKVPEGIPPKTIANYDESPMREDLGAKMVFVEKGVKNAEQARDSSKSIISIMFCGCVDGTMLPPYVVYKAGNIYPSWGVGGPKRRQVPYTTSTPSGWFDNFVYSKWFHEVNVPIPVDCLERKSSLETSC